MELFGLDIWMSDLPGKTIQPSKIEIRGLHLGDETDNIHWEFERHYGTEAMNS
jgi:hypothetical protein